MGCFCVPCTIHFWCQDLFPTKGCWAYWERLMYDCKRSKRSNYGIWLNLVEGSPSGTQDKLFYLACYVSVLRLTVLEIRGVVHFLVGKANIKLKNLYFSVRKIYINAVEVLYLSWGMWMGNLSHSDIWFGLSLKVTLLGRLLIGTVWNIKLGFVISHWRC